MTHDELDDDNEVTLRGPILDALYLTASPLTSEPASTSEPTLTPEPALTPSPTLTSEPTSTFEIIKCTFPIFTFFPLSYLVVGVGTQVIGNSDGVSAASASDLVFLTSVDGMSEVFSIMAPWVALLPCTVVGWLLVR